jgi:pyruvate dehydrogenase E2 component (dihydrolipoamide acetyltransferase)
MSTGTVVPVAVPDIGDFENVPIIEILVSPGDTVAVDDPLLTLESDKATMDVPAPLAGVVRELSVKVGDHVSEGDVLLAIEPSDAVAAADAVKSAEAAEVAAAPEGEAAPERAAPPPAAANGGAPVYASPSVRRLARELGVDLAAVRGTGRKGRITREDLQAAPPGGGAAAPTTGASGPGAPAAGPATGGPAAAGLAPWPSLDFSKQGPTERVPRTRIQRISAPNLARNWALIPHVTQHDEADITELEAWRKKLNAEHAAEDVKVTMVSFLVLACVSALKRFPDFNSSLDGDELILKRYYNIGFAADTPEGLVVPVIKGADEKGLLEIAHDLTELSGKARAGKLGPADISGATFTISSLGGIGGTAFTPIINAPEVAILGASRSAMKPVWDGTEFVPRLMLPLSLSYDHRVIDGAAAARFVVYLGSVLSDLREALL